MQTNDPINTMPIQAFLAQVKSADNSNAKELKMDITSAKNLATTLGIVMANQQGRLEKLIIENKGDANETVTISMDGGAGWK
jgi:hypothetical protein